MNYFSLQCPDFIKHNVLFDHHDQPINSSFNCPIWHHTVSTNQNRCRRHSDYWSPRGPELEKAILSVQAQTYPCTHYVFVDGEKFRPQAEAILKKYPQVKAIYLPMNTGAGGWYNSNINAAASALVTEDIVCFLDDDNTYRPNHVATIAAEFNQANDLHYAYSLRNFVDRGRIITQDNYLSLGEYKNKLPPKLPLYWDIQGRKLNLTATATRSNLIDVNCLALSHQMARKTASIWLLTGFGNDKQITNYLLKHAKGKGTGQYTVDYQINYDEKGFSHFRKESEPLFGKVPVDNFLEQQITLLSDLNVKIYGGKPWAKEE